MSDGGLSRAIGAALANSIGDKFGMVHLINRREYMLINLHVTCDINSGEVTCYGEPSSNRIISHSVPLCDPNWLSEIEDFIRCVLAMRRIGSKNAAIGVVVDD